MELTDGNVTLRTPLVDDAPSIAAAVRDSYETISPWMVWARPDYTTEDAIQWITNQIPGDADAVPLVNVDDDGTIAGASGLNGFDQLNRRANLGYWLRPDRTGRGYATGATRLVAAWGFDHLELERIEIIMSTENEPSRKVAERAGAAYEGVLRRRLRYHGRQHDAHGFVYLVDGPRP